MMQESTRKDMMSVDSLSVKVFSAQYYLVECNDKVLEIINFCKNEATFSKTRLPQKRIPLASALFL